MLDPAYVLQAEERVLYLFVMYALWNYVYAYFYPFQDGISGAPTAFLLLKYAVWFAVLGMLLPAVASSSRVNLHSSRHLPLAVWAYILLIHCVHIPFYRSPDGHLSDLANLTAFVPIVLLVSFAVARKVFAVLPYVMSIQVLLSALWLLFGSPLWDDSAIVGGLVNPNSFALALNLAIFWLVSNERHPPKWRIAMILLLSIGVVFTKSYSQLLVMFLGLGVYAALRMRKRLVEILLIAAAGVGAFLAAWNYGLMNKAVFVALALAFGLGSDAVSLFAEDAIVEGSLDSTSVSLRAEIHRFAFDFFAEANAIAALFGDFSSGRYHLFDSQYLMMAVNYGLLALVVLVCALFALSACAQRSYRRSRDLFPWLATLTFIVTFAFSRVLYYFPINVLFFLLWIYSWEQARLAPSVQTFVSFARANSSRP